MVSMLLIWSFLNIYNAGSMPYMNLDHGITWTSKLPHAWGWLDVTYMTSKHIMHIILNKQRAYKCIIIKAYQSILHVNQN